jgi:hypothetical protein
VTGGAPSAIPQVFEKRPQRHNDGPSGRESALQAARRAAADQLTRDKKH